MSTKIGFIGLGQMGKWMAINLVKAGFDTTVFDLNQAAVDELIQAGAKQAANPAELAQDNEWVLLSLPNT
ncbi:MAG: NAD(P)-binding domain-containing protein, partial [Desulfarculaceae bacterium]|nr:NAD(P)-binding domain-containing protein [Desulfarculaceae bacterium]